MSKTYYLAPTRDSPPSGPIALGNIIMSPRTPEVPINNRDSEVLRRLLKGSTSIKEEAATRNVSNHTGFAPGVWANFLGFAGLGAGAGVQLESGKAAEYRFCTLTSLTISPSMADIKAIFAEREVQDSLRGSRFRFSIYMITGVQIASGTTYTIAEAKSRGQYLHLSAELTPTGVPVTVGVGGQAATRSGQGAAAHIRDEFVFSYRLREIRYRRKAVNEVRECRNGDLLGIGDERREDNQEEGSSQEYDAAESPDLRPENPDLPEWCEMHTETAPHDDADGDKVVCVHVAGEDEDP
ncbi:hypothetical protein RB595_001432 [Gaeumannomyces hyphopodioides]